jgi:hypothetical protein
MKFNCLAGRSDLEEEKKRDEKDEKLTFNLSCSFYSLKPK